MNADFSPVSRANWTVVIFGFLALALAFSARAALGLVMPVWQEQFGWSSSYISSVGAAALMVMAFIAPFAGRLVDTKGPRFTLNFGPCASWRCRTCSHVCNDDYRIFPLSGIWRAGNRRAGDRGEPGSRPNRTRVWS